MSPERPAQRRLVLVFLLLMAALAVVLLLPADLIFGSARTDLSGQFLAWRAFAAASMRTGHLPLWNPYTYAGEPFLGDFQSAVLYPLNLIFLVLPLARAVNFSILLHLLILSFGMFAWAERRGLHRLASGLVAIVLPLSGAVWPHIYAGHLSNICTLAWIPWIFAGLESWYRERRPSGLLQAAAAIALQIFAGHAQYVYDTALAVGLHALVWSLAESVSRKRAGPAVICVYIAGAILAAVQLAPGLAATSEGIRQSNLSLERAGFFSFPPANLITLIAPGFFGDLPRHIYWGRYYLWEMTVFAGVSGLILMGVAIFDRERRRSARLDLILAAALFVVALGAHTPLFRILYEILPGFGRFRGSSKFTCQAMVFFVMAIGAGADALIRGRIPGRTLSMVALASGLAVGVWGLFIWTQPTTLAGSLVRVRDSGESDLPAAVFTDSAFVQSSGMQAGRSLVISGGAFVLVGASLFFAKRRPLLVWVPLGLLPLEMIGFACTHFATFRENEAVQSKAQAFIAAHPGDYRVLDIGYENNGVLLGAPDLWGNDPSVLKRYAEFMSFTQGVDPDQASQILTFHWVPPLYTMLRFRYAFMNSERGLQTFTGVSPPMDHVQLISDYRVLSGRDALFAAMKGTDFDPRGTVLLEDEPYPRPEPGTDPGSVRIVDSSSDQLTLEADVAHPTLLLVTDLYSRDWRVQSLPGSVQGVYRIQPANYILRAIPLAAGHHHLRMEYRPAWLRAGAVVSALALILWVAAGIAACRRNFSKKT